MGEKIEELQSLARALEVIRQFGPDRPRMRLSEVAQIANQNRATTRRVLRTLAKLGYVASEGYYFRLTPRVLELGYAYLSSQPWWVEAQRVVEELAEETDCPIVASVLEELSTVYVAFARPKRFATFVRSIGTRLPLQVSAQGRAILANLPEEERERIIGDINFVALTPHSVLQPDHLRGELEEVARTGYALVDQELELGLRTIAVPLRARTDEVFAGLGLGVREIAMTKEEIVERYLPLLLSGAEEIRANLPR